MTAAMDTRKPKTRPSEAPSTTGWRAPAPSQPVDLSAVICILAMFDLPLRQSVRSDLRDLGLEHLHEATTTTGLRHQIVNTSPDLVICDRDLPDGSVPGLIRDIRHGTVSENPFMVIVTLASPALSNRVMGLVGAGADDVISRPVSPRRVIGRVLKLIDARKPFVVTSDYTGPDRRNRKRSSGAPPGVLIEVPNTLHQKTQGGYDPQLVQIQIQTMRSDFNLRKVEQHAERIVYLSNLVLPTLRDGIDNGTLHRRLRKMNVLATDICRRVIETEYAPAADLCRQMCQVAKRLDSDSVDADDVLLLQQFTLAIDRAFDEGLRGAMSAQRIADFVREAEARFERHPHASNPAPCPETQAS